MLFRSEDEKVTSFLPVEEYKDGHFIIMATRNGVVKKTALKAFEKRYAPGLRAINLDEGDKLIGTIITDGKDEVCLASESGKAIRFSEGDVRPMGRSARGVRGMRIKKDQQIISLMVADNEKEILCVSENGFGKKTPVDDFPTHNRGGQGVISIKTSERNGLMVASTLVDNNDGIMLISDKGTMIRTSAEQIPTISRNTQGVKIITPKEGEKILECVRIDPEDEEE